MRVPDKWKRCAAAVFLGAWGGLALAAGAEPGADTLTPDVATVAGAVASQPALPPIAAPMPPTLTGMPSGLDDPFAGQTELSVEQLVAEVEQRNPSLQAMIAAWRGAAQRYPQVVSLDDPMFGFMLATANVGLNEGESGYVFEAAQAVPWPGKRQLRGSVAAAEAEAAQGQIGNTRLELAETARTAFYQYYLAQRQLEVNQTVTRLMQEFRDIAQSKYEVNQATQQDVLQAEVELGDLAGRRAELLRDQRVSIARINTLLHRAADHPLPLPPSRVEVLDRLPSADVLQQQALGSRPDLYALASQIRAEEANLALACKEYYPDMQFVARYDANMEDQRMRPMLGMNFNVPIRLQKRDAAAREAAAKIQQRRAEYQSRLDEVRFQVQSSLERLTQGREIVRLYADRILPAAEESLRAARANYTVGNVDFLRLLDAERQYNNIRERYHQAVAEYQTRLAELERAVGGSVSCAMRTQTFP